MKIRVFLIDSDYDWVDRFRKEAASSDKVQFVGSASSPVSYTHLDVYKRQVLTKLKWLNLQNNKIADDSILSGIASLEWVDISNNLMLEKSKT